MPSILDYSINGVGVIYCQHFGWRADNGRFEPQAWINGVRVIYCQHLGRRADNGRFEPQAWALRSGYRVLRYRWKSGSLRYASVPT